MPRLQSRIFWLLVSLLHAIAAAAWWVLMPGGFPADHPRFWVNQVLPPATIVLIAGTLGAARHKHFAIVRTVLLALAIAWLAASVSARVVFPISFRLRFAIPLLGAIAVGIACFAPALRMARLPLVPSVVAGLFAANLGALIPLSQRGEDPSTRPLNFTFPTDPLPPPPAAGTTRSLVGVDVAAAQGRLTSQRGRYTIYLHPLLTFTSRSPDRGWTLFAPPEQRMEPLRTLTGFRASDDAVDAEYADAIRTLWRLHVAGRAGGDDAFDVEAVSALDRPVYSHLNTFTELFVAGHRNLRVSFSPCSNMRFDVPYAEYPVGQPARFACLDEDGDFAVLQARSGEKGPFLVLAESPMRRSDPLAITLLDDDIPFARVTLFDWAQQASTALSPTAGWRVPVNAIEFGRDTQDPGSPASFFITLAATSVGRGFDTVGHTPGTYRNRVRFQWLP